MWWTIVLLVIFAAAWVGVMAARKVAAGRRRAEKWGDFAGSRGEAFCRSIGPAKGRCGREKGSWGFAVIQSFE